MTIKSAEQMDSKIAKIYEWYKLNQINVVDWLVWGPPPKQF